MRLEKILSNVKLTYNWDKPIYGKAFKLGLDLAKKDYKTAAFVIAGYSVYKLAEYCKNKIQKEPEGDDEI